jgi:hypothetical protein
MSDNKQIACIRLYYNPVSKVYSGALWEGQEQKEVVSGTVEAITDWLFCLGLSLEDVINVE